MTQTDHPPLTTDAESAAAPQVKPWVQGIAPYTPGRATGDDGRVLIKLSANENPLGSSAAVRLSGLWGRRDGWIENNGPGEDFGSQDRSAGRLALRWQATDAFTLDYAFDISKFGDSGTLTDSTAGVGNTLAFLGAPSASIIPGLLVAPIGTWSYTNYPFTGKRPKSVTSPRTRSSSSAGGWAAASVARRRRCRSTPASRRCSRGAAAGR